MADQMKVEREERLPPVHPGEVLFEDFMKPLGLSQYRLAQDLHVSPMRISQIVHGKRAVTADTALRLARYFGTSADVWMRLHAASTPRNHSEAVMLSLLPTLRQAS